MYHYVTIVTILAVAFYSYTSLNAGAMRHKANVMAPATTGDAAFERAFRVQMNTLEWMPIFLPLLWLCALYLNDVAAAVLGVAWIAGRALYLLGYTRAAADRGRGFAIQGAACVLLLLGALAGIIMSFAHGG